MRLFFGLPFDAESRAALLQVQRRLAEHAEGGKFTAAENFHLTLAFLGEEKEERLGELQAILRENPIPPMNLLFDRAGRFDNGVWYLAPRTCTALLSGQARLEFALRQAGFLLEERPYRPHLTLGRKVLFFKGKDPPQLLEQPVPAHSPGAALFHSHRIGGLLRYTQLAP